MDRSEIKDKIKNKIKDKIKKTLRHLYPETDGDIDYVFDNGDTILIKAIKSNIYT
jgi:hypothetical protein